MNVITCYWTIIRGKGLTLQTPGKRQWVDRSVDGGGWMGVVGGGGWRGGGAAVSRVVQPLWWVANFSHWWSWASQPWEGHVTVRVLVSVTSANQAVCSSRSLSLPARWWSLHIIHVGGFENDVQGRIILLSWHSWLPSHCVRCQVTCTPQHWWLWFWIQLLLHPLLLELSLNVQHEFLSRERPCLLSHGGMDVLHQRTSLGAHSKEQGLSPPVSRCGASLPLRWLIRSSACPSLIFNGETCTTENTLITRSCQLCPLLSLIFLFSPGKSSNPLLPWDRPHPSSLSLCLKIHYHPPA